ncbi:hypothetical protein [Ectobacillus sp. sgz5001026]|uniref:hypothetical protein n=1 Tax=Ectobacillus sp. sgz5001026 TaxID=3242473 RepID=UPI0036D242F9
MANKIIKFLIESGAEITGASTGAIIGTTIAGPAGTVIGAMGGLVAEKAFTKLGEEIQGRVLSKRESKKVGATSTYALEKIRDNLSTGKELRNDDFFDLDQSDRSDADEVIEGVIFSAQREHEEKKLKYYGNMLANIAFDESISKEQANQLIKISTELTYRQLCILRMIVMKDALSLRTSDFRGTGISGFPLISLLNEIYDLYNKGLINSGGEVLLGITDVNPSKLEIQGMGVLLYNLKELWTIEQSEIIKTASLLFNT